MRVYTDDDLYPVTDTGITIAFDRILRVGRIPYSASRNAARSKKRTTNYAPRQRMHQNTTNPPKTNEQPSKTHSTMHKEKARSKRKLTSDF